MEILISNLLRAGVVSSLSIVVVGMVLTFFHHPDYVRSTQALERLTEPGAAFPNTVPQVIEGVLDGRGQAVIVVGLLLLVATPVLRVALSLIVFLHQRDRIYVAITSLVLVLLLLSFYLGQAER
jgi:uncharacterized membrane protein